MSKDIAEPAAPVVLISYSHDAPEHKRWVGQLATKLMENRVDVILDQWETGPGDDLPKFMERAVDRADRVLLICTEAYVHKADDGTGGVGYEAMIVTGELVKNLGTRKFIPVIRQTSGSERKPKFLETRYHINLSEDRDFAAGLEELLRELHKAPVLPKPKLGKNPFEAEIQRMTELGASTEFRLDLVFPPEAPQDAGVAYKTALQLARKIDTLGWRKLTQRISSLYPSGLIEWQNTRRKNLPSQVEDLPQMVLEGISFCAPMMALALAGVESQQPQFSNQIGLIDEFLHPPAWERSGNTILTQFPSSIVFVYQALLGGLALQTQQPKIALRLANAEIPTSYSDKTEPLFRQTSVNGWPDSLNHTCTIAWKFLMQLPESWPWLLEIFGDNDSYQSALGGYYMFLTAVEFLDAIDQGIDLSDAKTIRLSVPITFVAISEHNQRKAARYFKESIPLLAPIWRAKSLSKEEMGEKWDAWLRLAGIWVSQVYRNGWPWGYEGMPIQKLPQWIESSE